jgi:hypothetical protein
MGDSQGGGGLTDPTLVIGEGNDVHSTRKAPVERNAILTIRTILAI